MIRRLLLAAAAAAALASPALAENVQIDPAYNTVKSTQTFDTSTAQTPVSGALVSNTLTAPFTPKTPRTFYLELTGTGSVTGAVVYLFNDGSTYGPEVVATDGGSPTVMNKIAYNGTTQPGVRMPLEVGQANMTVKFSPGAVTGTVNFAFVPGN